MKACDFPGARVIGKPREWVDELDGDCLSIYVVDTVNTLTGLPQMHSVYQLTDEEIAELQKGGVVRLTIVGMSQHPVFQLGVLSAELAAAAQIEPKGDLGPVIRGDT